MVTSTPVFMGRKFLIWSREYNRKNFGCFSPLLTMDFDKTVNYFGDISIDLLHMDGCPPYDSVKHDFES